jgi:hypothetical protein
MFGDKFMTKLAQTPDPRITWPTEQAPASAMVFAQNVIDVAATPGEVWPIASGGRNGTSTVRMSPCFEAVRN